MPPKTFAECAKVFTDCKDAEQFDGSDDEELNEQKKHEQHEYEPERAGDEINTTEFTTEINADESKIVNDISQL